jgi:hypothetical protein
MLHKELHVYSRAVTCTGRQISSARQAFCVSTGCRLNLLRRGCYNNRMVDRSARLRIDIASSTAADSRQCQVLGSLLSGRRDLRLSRGHIFLFSNLSLKFYLMFLVCIPRNSRCQKFLRAIPESKTYCCLCGRTLLIPLTCCIEKPGRSVVIAIGYWLNDRSSIPSRGKKCFSSPLRGSRLSYSVGTGESFPGGRAAEAWSWPLTSNSCWGQEW